MQGYPPCPRENAQLFQSCLEARNQDFELLGYSARQATLRFTGTYQNQLVIWFMTLDALADEGDELPLLRGSVKSYIDIGEESTDGRRIQVGLLLPHIDLPFIRKTITMIRNYKRLRPGRHEFGA